ncbi:DinB family protein (plasmid) [Deinococcus taeanensis]|uniref:DinB family protein n=1 Tax=Deinococcus taeanensis TaxID=2737050 RepID=UPI001CDB6C82|nr:DinB family protein [Deinococcus taeanensis]UBV44625.1 DinB family protein [Deinococcus taeanensis]
MIVEERLMSYTGEEYARQFQRHRSALLELLGGVPESKEHVVAWDGGMSILQTADHLFSTGAGVVDMLSGGTWEKQPPSPSLVEATERLRQNTASISQKLLAMTHDDLNRELIVFGGARWPAHRLIDFHREHEVHHKGQLWVMARMAGLEPPFFIDMGA